MTSDGRASEASPIDALHAFIANLHMARPRRVMPDEDGTIILTTAMRDGKPHAEYNGNRESMGPILLYAMQYVKFQMRYFPYSWTNEEFEKFKELANSLENIIKRLRYGYDTELPDRCYTDEWRESLGDIRSIGIVVLGTQVCAPPDRKANLMRILNKLGWEATLAKLIVNVRINKQELRAAIVPLLHTP